MVCPYASGADCCLPPAAAEDGWSLEAGAVLENLITDRALEAMVVGYAEDGTPFVNLYSIQGTEVRWEGRWRYCTRCGGDGVRPGPGPPEPTDPGAATPDNRRALGTLVFNVYVGGRPMKDNVRFQPRTWFIVYWLMKSVSSEPE